MLVAVKEDFGPDSTDGIRFLTDRTTFKSMTSHTIQELAGLQAYIAIPCISVPQIK